MISVLDYGAGNVGSVIRMIERAGGVALRIATPEKVLTAKKLVIPGVGAFDHGMSQIVSRQLQPALNEVALNLRIPVLGICLGMQLMCKSSDEGGLRGMGWVDAEVKRFPPRETSGCRVPHMGWNTLEVVRQNPLLSNDGEEKRFYFVHSYFVRSNDSSDIIALTKYGEDFVSAFQRGNIYGLQFHPEKSHRFGLELITRFVELDVA